MNEAMTPGPPIKRQAFSNADSLSVSMGPSSHHVYGKCQHEVKQGINKPFNFHGMDESDAFLPLILEFAKSKGWGQIELATELGVSAQTISNWKERGMAKNAILPALNRLGIQVSPFVRAQLLPAVSDAPGSDHHVVIGGDGNADLIYVPAIVGANLSAGDGEILCEADEESNAVAFRRDWFIDKGLRPERCKVWKVRGESMEPRYSHGDSLLLDMSDRTPRHGKRFALVGDEGLRVKQLLRGADHWIMHSHNPDKSRYPDEPIVQDNYAIIGRVRGRSGDED